MDLPIKIHWQELYFGCKCPLYQIWLFLIYVSNFRKLGNNLFKINLYFTVSYSLSFYGMRSPTLVRHISITFPPFDIWRVVQILSVALINMSICLTVLKPMSLTRTNMNLNSLEELKQMPEKLIPKDEAVKCLPD